MQLNTVWVNLLKGLTVTDRNKSMYIYGLALHTVSDMFAHSAYLIKDGKPTRIYHTTMDDDPKNDNQDADLTSYVPNRLYQILSYDYYNKHHLSP